MKLKEEMSCITCGKTFEYRRTSYNKYCTVKCQQRFQLLDRIRRWYDGEMGFTNRTLRSMLKEVRPYACMTCGITEWNGRPIVLDVEHIDGNSENNSPQNVGFICPNCHSQTPTYKGANRGNGRAYRRKRYAEGKSY